MLDTVQLDVTKVPHPTEYPFTLEIIRTLERIVFSTPVTFFVGENGTGKSTILEAIAIRAGFGREGGSRNIHFNTADEVYGNQVAVLAEALTLSWRKKPKDGYFFRAESFFNIGNYLDELAKEPLIGKTAYSSYGGISLHEQSHGESFLSFFTHRMGGGGFYILDEPEAALSPQRQLALLRVMHDVCKNPATQFIIATHSPLLLAYPGATIYSCDDGRLVEIAYTDTKQYEITKGFLDNPQRYLSHLFKD